MYILTFLAQRFLSVIAIWITCAQIPDFRSLWPLNYELWHLTWNFLYVIFMAPRILRCFLGFGKFVHPWSRCISFVLLLYGQRRESLSTAGRICWEPRFYSSTLPTSLASLLHFSTAGSLNGRLVVTTNGQKLKFI